ncbi:MAG: hypothetical protein AAB263_17680, partial [Planctomycetota bacterium]
MKTCLRIACICLATGFLSLAASDADHVTQYGITWTFDKAHPVGQFVTGDWWVVGPVVIVSVTPTPGKNAAPEKYAVKANQFGDTAMQQDERMRNGSMVVLTASGSQGYDSRQRNYDPGLSVTFPYTLAANRSLISTISNDQLPAPNFMAKHIWASEQHGNYVLKTAAVLTALSEVPPTDAFRPPYAGMDKPIYRAKDLNYALLPQLKPVDGTPDPDEIIRFF